MDHLLGVRGFIPIDIDEGPTQLAAGLAWGRGLRLREDLRLTGVGTFGASILASDDLGALVGLEVALMTIPSRRAGFEIGLGGDLNYIPATASLHFDPRLRISLAQLF